MQSELPIFDPSLLNINRQPRITRYQRKPSNMKDRDKTEMSKKDSVRRVKYFVKKDSINSFKDITKT